MHRIRTRLVSARTALVNQTRGLLSDYGETEAKTLAAFKKLLHRVTDEGFTGLSVTLKEEICMAADEYASPSLRINRLNKKLNEVSIRDQDCARLTSIPGIGSINATAIV